MRLIIDIETDNLLYECTKIHCIGVRDVDSDYHELIVGDEAITKWLKDQEQSNNTYIGHNLFVFDLPVIKKLYGVDLTIGHRCEDTLILSQVLYSNIRDLDYTVYKPPPKYIGRHSLGAWGERLRCYKQEYAGDFQVLTDDMIKYCDQDTEVTKTLYIYMMEHKKELCAREDCIDLEYKIAVPLARQQSNGIEFNVDGANELLCTLMSEKARIKWELQQLFQPRVINKGEVTPKVNSKKYHTTKGATYTKIEFQEYNPGSRQQTVDRLCKELGWKPQEFTEKGNVELDEEIIESLPFDRIKPLKDFYIVNKRIGQLADGAKAWLKVVKPNGRIYGSLLQSGTITGRSTHFDPNLSQVPSNDKPYGKQCRALFRATTGMVQIGCDADALEARTMAGFLKKFDKGRMITSLLEGKKELKTDMHSLNAEAYGVDEYPQGRDCSKTLFYGTVYGCGDAKRGLILQQFGINFHNYVPSFAKDCESLGNWVTKKGLDWSDAYIECFVAGRRANDLFGEKFPALPKLIEDVTEKWKERGYLIGLDGRKLYPRKVGAVFNTLNQSAGAIIMKKALDIADQILQTELMVGRDYEFLINCHDEWQLEVIDNKDIIELVSQVTQDSIKSAGEFFSFPCPMKGTVKIGRTWAETH